MGKKSPKHRKDHESPYAKKARQKPGKVEDHDQRAKFGLWGTIILFIYTTASVLSFRYYQYLVTYTMFIYFQLIIWATLGAVMLWFYYLYKDEGDVYKIPLIVMGLYMVITIPMVLLSNG